MDLGGRLTPEQMDAVVADAQNRVRESFDSMPVFGVSGWSGPVMIGEWSWRDGSRGLAHGNPDGGSFVQVHTHPDGARLAVHDLRMSAAGVLGTFTDFDYPPDRLAEITVDETPVLFEVWEDEAIAWAGGNYLEHGIVIEARRADLAALQLSRVTDIEPYLTGQLELILRARREAGSHEI
jgi:hypothetical protein